MFVQDFIEVPRSTETVLDRLVEADWLQERAPLGRVTLGVPRRRDEAVLVPFTLDLDDDTLAVAVNGDLELIALPDGGTHVVVSASYPRPRSLSHDSDVSRQIAVAVRRVLSALQAALVPGGTLV